MTRDDARRIRWEERTRVPFIALAFVYLAAWTVVAIDERRVSVTSLVAIIVLLLVWLTFIVDYIVRLALAGDRVSFVAKSVPDLVAAILPALRPVVQLRFLASVPYFRRRTGSAQRLRVVILMVAFAVVFVYSMSLAVLVAERDADGAVILTLPDALWWACVTLFTVGYGDLYPVTVIGRLWTILLMIGGVGIIGSTSALVVSYLGDRVNPPRDDETAHPAGPERPDAGARS
ncbi:potassium channel family protein [Homoserinibacter sp. GY 40078]|uniref:potassium channel family protein n=1 Tax=Homoserinibacter sp. GY 40078 TaxID=2603275 RepID=UPI0011C93746|nr:potassium channel family protein [Homoserinibacter sp. GY 40078]TXK18992.1 two pore domain potassium channel family protein [Homoserinibacter sp. GY 40078]